MKSKFRVNKKDVVIFVENSGGFEELPVVVYNSFSDDVDVVFDEALKLDCKNFVLAGISNLNWNDEMTPYYMEGLFKGEQDYLGQADLYLEELENEIVPRIKDELLEFEIGVKEWIVAGYSLSGLFAIYSMYRTDLFCKYVSCSGSFWYKDFDEFIFENVSKSRPEKIYLSLGDKEKFSRNAVLASVEDKTLSLYEFYKKNSIDIEFEMNEGNHFKDSNFRVAKGILKILDKG